MTDVEQILRLLKRLTKDEQNSFLKVMKISSFAEVSNTISQSLKRTENIIFEQNILNASRFMKWNDLWNDFGIYGSKKTDNRNDFAKLRYNKGDLVWIDFGEHNIGSEFSYSHIAVIVKDFGNLITVIPVTSDKDRAVSKDIEKLQIKVDCKVYTQFSKNSILLLTEII